MIESEQTCSRSVPDFMVNVAPSGCGWTAITGFMGAHCASAADENPNKNRIAKMKRSRCVWLRHI